VVVGEKLRFVSPFPFNFVWILSFFKNNATAAAGGGIGHREE
jgi:hypothetical protein